MPVIDFDRESFMPGGAANVARNLAALNASTTLFGVVGRDGAARQLRNLLAGQGVSCAGLQSVSARMTTRKIRIIAQPEYEGTDFSGFACQPDHADKYETSMMMAVRPELVHMEHLRPTLEIPSTYPPRPNAWGFVSPKGTWTWSEDLGVTASPELGERVIQALLDHLSQRIEEECAKL